MFLSIAACARGAYACVAVTLCCVVNLLERDVLLHDEHVWGPGGVWLVKWRVQWVRGRCVCSRECAARGEGGGRDRDGDHAEEKDERDLLPVLQGG